MDMKPFYEMTYTELMNTSPTLLELQLQEGQISWMAAAEYIKQSCQIIENLRMQLDFRDSEEKRKHEWWLTFRAALGGYASSNKLTLAEVQDLATMLTDSIHGPLEKPATE